METVWAEQKILSSTMNLNLMMWSWCSCLAPLHSCLLSRNTWLKAKESPKHSAALNVLLMGAITHIWSVEWLLKITLRMFAHCISVPCDPESHRLNCDWSGDTSCVPQVREQRGAGHQEITEAHSRFWIPFWHRTGSRRCLFSRRTQGNCLSVSHFLCIAVGPFHPAALAIALFLCQAGDVAAHEPWGSWFLAFWTGLKAL